MGGRDAIPTAGLYGPESISAETTWDSREEAGMDVRVASADSAGPVLARSNRLRKASSTGVAARPAGCGAVAGPGGITTGT